MPSLSRGTTVIALAIAAAVVMAPVAMARGGGVASGMGAAGWSHGGTTGTGFQGGPHEPADNAGTNPRVSPEEHGKKGGKSAAHSNKGGQVRGLQRADETAGVHGDTGRDRAEAKQSGR